MVTEGSGPLLTQPFGAGGLQTFSSCIANVSNPFCAAVNQTGSYSIYDGTAWSPSQSIPGSSGGITALSCASASFCAAVDDSGNAFEYNGSSWSASPIGIDGSDTINSVSCAPDVATYSICVAVDAAGNAIIYRSGTWSAPEHLLGSAFSSVSCATATFCAAVGSGAALTYDGTSWSSIASIDLKSVLSSVSCPYTDSCAAVDLGGNALTYDGTSWSSPESVDPYGELVSVACLNGALCLAGDNHANVFVGASPTCSPTPGDDCVLGGKITPIQFAAPLGATSGSTAWTLTNQSSSSITISSDGIYDSTTYSGGNASGLPTGDEPLSPVTEFGITSDTCNALTLAPGAQCAIGIAFAPTQLGSATNLVCVYHSAVSNPNGTTETQECLYLDGTTTTGTETNPSNTAGGDGVACPEASQSSLECTNMPLSLGVQINPLVDQMTGHVTEAYLDSTTPADDILAQVMLFKAEPGKTDTETAVATNATGSQTPPFTIAIDQSGTSQYALTNQSAIGSCAYFEAAGIPPGATCEVDVTWSETSSFATGQLIFEATPAGSPAYSMGGPELGPPETHLPAGETPMRFALFRQWKWGDAPRLSPWQTCRSDHRCWRSRIYTCEPATWRSCAA
jgi:hypothetical protein